MPEGHQIILGEKTLSSKLHPKPADSPPSTPAWVKVLMIIFIALVLFGFIIFAPHRQ
jgi:hypothetical protein